MSFKTLGTTQEQRINYLGQQFWHQNLQEDGFREESRSDGQLEVEVPEITGGGRREFLPIHDRATGYGRPHILGSLSATLDI